MQRRITLSSFFLFFMIIAFGQQQNSVDLALRALESNSEKWELEEKDIEEPLISDTYTTKHNNVTHVYLNQTVNGIPVNNAMATINIQNGKIIAANASFVSQAYKLVLDGEASLSVEEAIQSSLLEMQIPSSFQPLVLKNRKSENHMVFAQPDFSNSEVIAKLVYQMNDKNELILAWDYTLDMKTNSDYWSVRVDANTGKIVNKHNYTIYCNHDHSLKNTSHKCASHDIVQHKETFKSASSAIVIADATYNVFALPAESPIHGPQVLTEDPQLIVEGASPLGWHETSLDTFTITRGNNVWAYGDTDGNNIPDGDEPDGGEELFFDFPYDNGAEPADLNGLAHVNLFYMVNMMHDISYSVGFDEVSGNFQASNFGNGGLSGDFVRAEGQDGSGTNNANFATPPDGGSGTMQMFLWDNTGGLLRLNEPSQLEGFYASGTAAFGPDIIALDENVEAECILVNDANGGNGGSVTDGCTEIMNNLEGKIAIIDRGSCFFYDKVFNAQEAGAVAALICNIPGASTAGDDGNDPFGMAAPADLPVDQVTIPSLGVGKATCDAIKLSLAAEIPVIAHIANHDIEGPDMLDGDFDNGIIAHEFAHGISNRLTGGPSQAGCLGSAEQMGEGWSDFFSLITTVEAGDTGADLRGIGNFADAQNANGNGIRNYPYSTDMDINPSTYDYIKSATLADGSPSVHAVGEVWNAMIWDLYWAFVDLYGWDADWNNKESGNYKAVLLVMDGMKMQVCGPGFVDGRNGILQADVANFNGDHQCLIWGVFARRGLGYFALQGSSNDIGDGTENFESLPTCIEELKIRKEVTRLIAAGDEVDITLTVTNHVPNEVNDVIVSDDLPSGLTYIDGSASTTANVVGNTINFELGNMAYEDEIVITYKAISDPDNKSIASEFQNMEDIPAANAFFEREALNPTINFFNIVTSDSYSPDKSWYVESVAETSDQTLKTRPFTVSGNNPTLKFFHKWNTQGGADGGFVQVATNGNNWELLEDEFFENGYTSALGYGTLAIPNLSSFSGSQSEWIASFADLSAYAGQEIQLRFRFACNDDIIANGDLPGWHIDDFEITDLVSYSSEACVNASNVDVEACTDPQVTFVDSDGISAVVGVDLDHFGLEIYPNPASQQVHIAVSSKVNASARAGIFSLDGRMMRSANVELSEVAQTLQFDIRDFSSGIYLIKVETEAGAITEKLIVH